MKPKEMKLHKIISKNEHKSQMEIVITDGINYQTKHVYKKTGTYQYFDHKDNKGKPIYKSIVMERG